MKTAIVHDWLVSLGGAEKVLQAVLEIYPSPIFTLLKSDRNLVGEAPVITSFIQKLPFATKLYRNYLPFFPLAIERFDVSEYDLIISNSHAIAKGVKTDPNQLHICYCHTPMRYGWDLQDQYLSQLGSVKTAVAKQILKYLRKWDLQNSERVDYFIANSKYIAERVERIYGTPAHVIYPPVATDQIDLVHQKEEFYVTVSRLVPYKRVDLIVEAFTQMASKKLFVIGEGPELDAIQKKAGPNISFLGFQSDAVVREYLGRAKAFVFAALEDFGIVPLEAQAAGTPVIAYGKGGSLETVIEGETGVFFQEQSVPSLIEAVDRFEKMEFDPTKIRSNADRFSEARFKVEFKQFVEEKWEKFCENHHTSRR